MLIPMIAIVAFAAIRIARIFADRPAGSSPDLTDRVAELERDVQGVQQQLAETEERLDFAERLLAKGGSQ